MNRHTLKLLIPCALLAVLIPGLVLAQGGPPINGPGGSGGPGFHRDAGGFGHRLGRLARILELSDEQIAASRELAQAHRADVQPLRQEQRASREAVRALLGEDPQDPTAIGQEVINGHNVGQQIRASFEQLMEDFRALLTQEQQEKLDEYLEMRQNLRGERGERGGLRGPGRGGRGGPGA